MNGAHDTDSDLRMRTYLSIVGAAASYPPDKAEETLLSPDIDLLPVGTLKSVVKTHS